MPEDTIPDFSEIGRGRGRKSKKTDIPTTSYNRKVLTYSQLLGEVFEKVTGKGIHELFTASLLNEIGKVKGTGEEVKKFLVKNNNLTKEFPKPTDKDEANQYIKGM